MLLQMMPVFIYALDCPITGAARYVGQTVYPDRRLRRHINESRKEKWHVHKWIKSLLSKNLRPIMEILDVVPDNEADFWEREYIQNFRERGFNLTNLTDGGEGFEAGEKHPCFGKKPSITVRQNMRLAHLGKKLSLQTRKSQSEGRFSRKKPGNSSGFVGVCWQANKWRARFNIFHKATHVGYFSKIEDAVFARALAVDKYFSL